MKRLSFKILRKKPAQAIAQSSLTASAAAPDSGFAFVHNSQGASAALNELAGKLSGVLELVDLDLNESSEDGAIKAQLQRLEAMAGGYANSSSTFCDDLQEWKGPESLAQVVAAAYSCSATIYKKPPKAAVLDDGDEKETLPDLKPDSSITHRRPHVEGTVFTEQEYNKPSQGGTEKAMGVWMARTQEECEGFPALIIAVRGTSKLVDAMVNANGRPVAAGKFLGTENGDTAIQEAMAGLKAHAGFLSSAKALYPSVNDHLIKASQDYPGLHVVFAGHSAGGAVSSLLYTKCLLEAKKTYPNLQFSSITFGAPPCLSIDITATLRTGSVAGNLGHAMVFVNEFDIVPRVDQAYIRSLVDLYRASYDLEPLTTKAMTQENTETPYVLPPLRFQTDQENGPADRDSQREPKKVWKLPVPEYHIAGEIVLLRKDRISGARILRAYKISHHQYERLLYVGTQTHSRTYYHDRVELLRQGRFNA